MEGVFEFIPTIGLEIHVQLKTRTKLFCSCPTGDEHREEPNKNVCPICCGFPGVLPVPNKRAVILAVRAAKILNMRIQEISVFARKNYFYPDLPKNYQISQYELPLARDGFLEVDGKFIRIQRLHLEEDAGKLIHQETLSYVDFSRSGVPLIEIVTYPDIDSPELAQNFLKKLHKYLVWCDVTEGSMEEGNLRCDVNISIKRNNEEKLGVKVEVKNINSFRFVKEALEYEIKRQIEIIQSGGKIVQETRLFDSVSKKTYSMRRKEYEEDYRYFPDPDLLPLKIDKEILEEAEIGIPELPDLAKKRFISSYNLDEYQADVLTSERKLKEFFEDLAVRFEDGKLLANFILEEVLRAVKEDEKIFDDENIKIGILKTLSAQKNGIITRNLAKDVFKNFLQHRNIQKLDEDIQRNMVSGEIEIEKILDEIFEKYPKEVERFKKGEEKLLGFFIGEAMKRLQKRGDPKTLREIILKKLNG